MLDLAQGLKRGKMRPSDPSTACPFIDQLQTKFVTRIAERRSHGVAPQGRHGADFNVTPLNGCSMMLWASPVSRSTS